MRRCKRSRANLRRARSLVLLLAFALAATGCVASRKSLFDTAKAVTPAKPGTYATQNKKGGKWVQENTFTLREQGGRYIMGQETSAGLQLTEFEVHEAAKDTYVAVNKYTSGDFSGGRYTNYVLLEKDGDAYAAYLIACKDLKFVRLPRSLQPLLDGDYCIYEDRDTLVQALLAYAKLSNPDTRYVRVGP